MGTGAPQKVGRIDDAALLAAADSARHLRELLQLLGLAAYGGNYECVRARLERLDALHPRFQRRAGPRSVDLTAVTTDRLRQTVSGCTSLHAVLRALGLPLSSTAYRALRDRLLLDGLQVGAPDRSGPRRPRVPIEQLLVSGRPPTSGGHLKRRLLAEGLLEDACAACGITAWCGGPAPLELDHVNGDRRDNRLTNLRLLCANCHAQTPTYRGRNVGRSDLVPAYRAGAARVVERKTREA